jgi:hypothetical protein
MIRRVRISGDLLLSDRRVPDNLERILSGCTLQEAQAAAQAAPLTAGIRETLLGLLTRLALEVTPGSPGTAKESGT